MFVFVFILVSWLFFFFLIQAKWLDDFLLQSLARMGTIRKETLLSLAVSHSCPLTVHLKVHYRVGLSKGCVHSCHTAKINSLVFWLCQKSFHAHLCIFNTVVIMEIIFLPGNHLYFIIHKCG